MTDPEQLAEAKVLAREGGWPDEMYLGLMDAAIRSGAIAANRK